MRTREGADGVGKAGRWRAGSWWRVDGKADDEFIE